MCQTDNYPIKELTPTKGHQRVLNTAGKSRSKLRALDIVVSKMLRCENKRVEKQTYLIGKPFVMHGDLYTMYC